MDSGIAINPGRTTDMQSLYILSCVPEADGGIYRYGLDEDGRLCQLGFTALPNTNWMIFSADRSRAYATCSVEDGHGVAAFCVEPDGSLAELSRCAANGRASCHLCLTPDERRLFCANYTSGSVSEFAVAADGGIQELLRVHQHHGSGVNLPRQDGPHTHFTAVSPDGRYMVVNDLGLDAIYAYPLDGGEPVVSRIAPAGTGPRHLAFTPDGRHAYLLTELFSQVIWLDYHDGHFTCRRHYSAVASDYCGYTIGAALRFSPDGRFLLASNRGEDSIICWEIGEQGALRRTGRWYSGGHHPRDFNFSADGRWVFAANELSGDVYCFAWHEGILRPQCRTLHLRHPLMVTP